MKKDISINVRAGSEKEEFGYLLFVLGDMDFYTKEDFEVVLPDVKELRSVDVLNNKQESFELFKKSEYKREFFNAGLKVIKNKEGDIRKCLDMLPDFNWGFKLFDNYQIILTKYGPGGSYDENDGVVILLTTKEGEFKETYVEQTVIHEIIHIGIEDSIVKKFKLEDWEKERLVDLIILILFNDIFIDYYMQSSEKMEIDKYITKKSLIDLPKAIKKYVSKYPR